MAFSGLLAVTAMLILSPRFPFLAAWQTTLTCAAAMAGLLGVFTSAMVYVDTRRPFWSPRFAFVTFFGTTLLLGATFTAVVIGCTVLLPPAHPHACPEELPREPMKIALPSPLSPSNSFLRQWTGPLTEDLVLHPADFGLGQVPARLKPAATTRSVCGFCSTGCSLDIHLKDGVAGGLLPTTDYPGKPGMACPTGWGSLAPPGAAH